MEQTNSCRALFFTDYRFLGKNIKTEWLIFQYFEPNTILDKNKYINTVKIFCNSERTSSRYFALRFFLNLRIIIIIELGLKQHSVAAEFLIANNNPVKPVHKPTFVILENG